MNPVVGDVALLEKYGTSTLAVAEGEKVATHLEYALRSLEQAYQPDGKRLDMLLELESFIADGIFPQLEVTFYSGSSERSPCFIDSSGSACAVAYLMLSTPGHSELALRIAQKHRHSTIAEIAADAAFSAEFTAWQEQSGLSLEELQLIQPTYTVSSPGSAAAAAALHESWHIALQVQLPQRADSLSNRLRAGRL
jgi:hypothetical protein